MKVLLIGSAAREHAIAEVIAKNAELVAAMEFKNPGIAKLSSNVHIGRCDNANFIKRVAKNEDPDFAVIGPEAPLDAGIANVLEDVDVPCIGPLKTCAKIETDKSFARTLMQKYRIDGIIDFKIFDDINEAISFIDSFEKKVVVKPAGLTGGKGVKIEGEQLKNKEEVIRYIRDVLRGGIGEIKRVVIEEKCEGEEFTLQCFTDGKHVAPMPLVQDHKRAYEGDVGPNTGGMGSYSDRNHLLPFLDEKDKQDAISIMKKTVSAIKKETGERYKGILYGQFMLTADGVKVVEYNARFGDPEAMNVLPILESDFTDICYGILDGKIKEARFKKVATVVKYLVPEGYPENPVKNEKILVEEEKIKNCGGKIFYASVYLKDGSIYTTKSRAIAVMGSGDSIDVAERVAEQSTHYIKGRLEHRRDIGKRELIEKRIRHMEELKSRKI